PVSTAAAHAPTAWNAFHVILTRSPPVSLSGAGSALGAAPVGTRPPGGASCWSCLLLRLCWAGGFLMCAQIREEGRSLGGERVVVDDVAAPGGQRPVIALLVGVDQRPHPASLFVDEHLGLWAACAGPHLQRRASDRH